MGEEKGERPTLPDITVNDLFDEDPREHQRRSDIFNDNQQTAKWITSSVQAALRKSSLSKKDILVLVEDAVRRADSDGGE